MSRLSFTHDTRRRAPLLALGFALTLNCMHNRPGPPTTPIGPASVEVSQEYSFKTWVVGQDSGPVHFRFDWGDGQTSPWIVLGETIECSHLWTHAGVYHVRAQVHDNRPELSGWSDPLNVTVAVPSYPYRLVDSVAIGGALYDAQVLPNGEFVYVTEMLGGVLSVVRTSDLDLVAQIPLNEGWWGEGDVQVMCSPDGDYVYPVPYSYDCVGIVRTASQLVVDSLKLGEEIGVICSAISPDGRHLYVAVDAESGFVVVSRLPEGVVEDTIFTPGVYTSVTSMKVAPDGSRLYSVDISDWGWRVCATRLSDYAIEWQVPDEEVSEGSGALVVHPSGSRLYVLDEERVSVRGSGNGFIVGGASLESPWSAEIAPDGSFLYVACAGTVSNGALAVVRTSDNKVVRVIAMPTGFEDVAPSPDGQKLYVAGENGKLYVLGR
jgi:DNA-binding beta-propeller fold protein YncE